ncbi:hypothetical protein GCM10010428_32850 [Actinosynnema pretiosum subsp. pretiosum]
MEPVSHEFELLLTVPENAASEVRRTMVRHSTTPTSAAPTVHAVAETAGAGGRGARCFGMTVQSDGGQRT